MISKKIRKNLKCNEVKASDPKIQIESRNVPTKTLKNCKIPKGFRAGGILEKNHFGNFQIFRSFQ